MDDIITKTKPPNEEEEEEEEDAISVSDDKTQSSQKSQDKRRSSSEPSDFFEFFTSPANMSNAEDIIFHGKLIPFKNHHPFLKSLSADDATRFSRRTSLRSPIELVPTVKPNRLTSTRPRPRRYPDVAGNIRRSFSKRSTRSEGSPPSKASKAKWFVLMFGPLKLQPEMDIREMKSRVGRRSPRSMFLEYAGGDTQAGRSGRRSFWGFDFLRVLSCKSHASVAVTASVGLAAPRPRSRF
ncbi:hypothetical protein CASFOL_032704 [Castilleja foliolosa]|uniref:Uncharacterized protein n=1 Tax=Castilleja foliolosa TaxID=1961234 RepID=A0ABD3C289_9LAMI